MELLEEDERDEIAFSGIPDIISRYYMQYFYMNVEDQEGHDQYVYQHSNHNCVIGLADTHPIVKERKTIKYVNFKPNKLDHLNMEVKGKTKKGGHWMQDTAKLCEVTCSDGTVYPIIAAVKGHLIEVNRRLVQDYTLLPLKARKEGYVAIIKPKYTEQKTICSHLTSQKEFMQKRFGQTAPADASSGSGSTDEAVVVPSVETAGAATMEVEDAAAPAAQPPSA